jgi:predicted acetyltransferase
MDCYDEGIKKVRGVLMDCLKLVLSDLKYKNQYLEMIEECHDDIINTGFECLIPTSNSQTLESDIDKLIKIHMGKGLPCNWVPASTFWLMHDNCCKIIGVITIRHYLNEQLKFRGGHIAYYVRPSERNRGYATKMLALALEQCKQLCIQKVLITCKKDNTYSAKTIENNGGIFTSEDIDNGQLIQRYWIDLY